MISRLFPTRDFTGGVRRLALIAGRSTLTNRRLVDAARALGWNATVLRPAEAECCLRPGDLALGRLDVLATLDGIEPGLETLSLLESQGVSVLNGRSSLLAAHDKLATALRLAERGLRHPRTAFVDEALVSDLDFPVVVKPRFGSWGTDVVVCHSRLELLRRLRSMRQRPWFARQGAIAQELIPPRGRDLRLLVVGGAVVGAIERVAAPGEWRTNVALGGHRRATTPGPEARELALQAASAIGADFVGVDLLPDGNGGYVVLEINGAVDFTQAYALDAECVFQRVVAGLGRSARDAAGDAPISLSAGIGV